MVQPGDLHPLARTSVMVSRLGLGTGMLGAIRDPAVWSGMIEAAFQGGIRSLDTSPYYGFGNSEIQLGRALEGKPREQFVLSTKVGRLLRADGPVDEFAEQVYYPAGRPADALRSVYDYSGAGVVQSLCESLERLHLDRVDVLLIHDIIELASGVNHVREVIEDAYPALSELREKGTISALGAGVQVNELIPELLAECALDCFVLAGRYTLLDQSALQQVLPLCEERNVAIIIASPYNTGILHDPVPGATFDFLPASDELIAKAKAIKDVCDSFGIPLPAAALQFPFGHPAVVQVLTGAVRVPELQENLSLLQVKIPPELWAALKDRGLLDARAPVPA